MSTGPLRPDPDFIDYVLELAAPVRAVYARRMFGGCGLFIDGLMFALIAGETLYLKTDTANRPAFESRGLQPFRYERAGRRIALSYFEAPAEALDDTEALLPWLQSARAAARRQKTSKAHRKTRRPVD